MFIRMLCSGIRRHLRVHNGFTAVPVRYYEDPHKGYRPYWNKGEGNYGSTLGKQSVVHVQRARESILSLVKTIPFTDKDSAFNIAEYGAADGSTSMAIFGELLMTLKDHHGPNTQFQIIYEDLELNDFKSLFKRISGIIPDPPSYLLEMDNVYVLASGTNFYKQCVPKISKDEFVNTNMSLCYRTMKEVRKPFDDKTSPVSRSGLTLLSAEAAVNPDVFYNIWREKKDKAGIDDREEFARMYVSAHRNWSNSTFMNGLSDSRSQEEKEQIVDGLYGDVKERLSRMNPKVFKDDGKMIYIVIRKE
ncbi:uncharacterized protein [Haliotis asinina]|uniref:uncharacterized protein n=1 Tax=Haliotis asinina TaxID=109174 RepID=UPI003531C736